MLGKNGLHIRVHHEKSHQNDDFFFLGFEKVLKMQASNIYTPSTDRYLVYNLKLSLLHATNVVAEVLKIFALTIVLML